MLSPPSYVVPCTLSPARLVAAAQAQTTTPNKDKSLPPTPDPGASPAQPPAVVSSPSAFDETVYTSTSPLPPVHLCGPPLPSTSGPSQEHDSSASDARLPQLVRFDTQCVLIPPLGSKYYKALEKSRSRSRSQSRNAQLSPTRGGPASPSNRRTDGEPTEKERKERKRLVMQNRSYSLPLWKAPDSKRGDGKKGDKEKRRSRGQDDRVMINFKVPIPKFERGRPPSRHASRSPTPSPPHTPPLSPILVHPHSSASQPIAISTGRAVSPSHARTLSGSPNPNYANLHYSPEVTSVSPVMSFLHRSMGARSSEAGDVLGALPPLASSPNARSHGRGFSFGSPTSPTFSANMESLVEDKEQELERERIQWQLARGLPPTETAPLAPCCMDCAPAVDAYLRHTLRVVEDAAKAFVTAEDGSAVEAGATSPHAPITHVHSHSSLTGYGQTMTRIEWEEKFTKGAVRRRRRRGSSASSIFATLSGVSGSGAGSGYGEGGIISPTALGDPLPGDEEPFKFIVPVPIGVDVNKALPPVAGEEKNARVVAHGPLEDLDEDAVVDVVASAVGFCTVDDTTTTNAPAPAPVVDEVDETIGTPLAGLLAQAKPFAVDEVDKKIRARAGSVSSSSATPCPKKEESSSSSASDAEVEPADVSIAVELVERETVEGLSTADMDAHLFLGAKQRSAGGSVESLSSVSTVSGHGDEQDRERRSSSDSSASKNSSISARVPTTPTHLSVSTDHVGAQQQQASPVRSVPPTPTTPASLMAPSISTSISHSTSGTSSPRKPILKNAADGGGRILTPAQVELREARRALRRLKAEQEWREEVEREREEREREARERLESSVAFGSSESDEEGKKGHIKGKKRMSLKVASWGSGSEDDKERKERKSKNKPVRSSSKGKKENAKEKERQARKKENRHSSPPAFPPSTSYSPTASMFDASTSTSIPNFTFTHVRSASSQGGAPTKPRIVTTTSHNRAASYSASSYSPSSYSDTSRLSPRHGYGFDMSGGAKRYASDGEESRYGESRTRKGGVPLAEEEDDELLFPLPKKSLSATPSPLSSVPASPVDGPARADSAVLGSLAVKEVEKDNEDDGKKPVTSAVTLTLVDPVQPLVEEPTSITDVDAPSSHSPVPLSAFSFPATKSGAAADAISIAKPSGSRPGSAHAHSRTFSDPLIVVRPHVDLIPDLPSPDGSHNANTAAAVESKATAKPRERRASSGSVASARAGSQLSSASASASAAGGGGSAKVVVGKRPPPPNVLRRAATQNLPEPSARRHFLAGHDGHSAPPPPPSAFNNSFSVAGVSSAAGQQQKRKPSFSLRMKALKEVGADVLRGVGAIGMGMR